jgi:general nucleoside transport system permease protein
VATPSLTGLIMIGGEGALVLGGFAAAALAIPLVGGHAPVMLTLILMAVFGMLVGGFWVGLSGFLRYARGVNETISSLLLTYIGIAIMNFFVEGALRDLSNPNKPSTMPIGDAYMVGKIPGTQVHWGFAFGLILCAVLYVLMTRTTFGFAARVTGGNLRAALAQGLPVGRLIVACSAIAGACSGLAGFFEVTAIQGRANASLAAGYGFTGILVSFLARHNPLVIPPVAILLGGLVASGGLIQRRMDLPDATVLVLQGLIFIVLLTSETLYGRFAIFRPSGGRDRA